MKKSKNKEKLWFNRLKDIVLILSLIINIFLGVPKLWNMITGQIPTERVLLTETVRSLNDELTLLLVDINATAIVNIQNGNRFLYLTLNQDNLGRLQKLSDTPGFDSIARLKIDRTSVIMNQVGLAGRINDINPTGQLTPVDIEILKSLR